MCRLPAYAPAPPDRPSKGRSVRRIAPSPGKAPNDSDGPAPERKLFLILYSLKKKNHTPSGRGLTTLL